MDEKLIEQLLNEDIPEWDYDEFRSSKDKKIVNINGDNGSVYTDVDDENGSCKMNSSSNYGGRTLSSNNDIMSIHSASGTPILSPVSQRRYYISPPSLHNEDGSYNSILPHRTGKLIKHAILTKVANQIFTSKSKTGYPTCIARGKYLAIGTSKGMTFLFDLKQVLKFYVGLEDGNSTFGAVSSLSFNVGNTRLLVGFVKAHINMWDISGSEGKLLRSIDVNQGPGYAVSFVRFLPDPTMAVYADTNGSVFQLIFKRGIGGRSTDLECFFSGSRGEILCLETLFIPKHMKKVTLEEHSLLAMASFTKVIVVSCKPQLKVKFMHPLKGKPDTMPHLEWSYNTRISKSDVSQTNEVFLTFARNSDIHILRITSTLRSVNDISLDSGDLKFDLIFHMALNAQILSLKWMNQYCIGVVDFDEQFHAVDIQTKSIIESLNMKSAQIVYNTSLFKSTATGGNVSEAMSAAAEKACYHSVVEHNGQIKILGQQEIHIVMLRPWIEAVEFVRKNEGAESAFKMCSELYKGHNIVCRQVLMLPPKDEERQRAVTKVSLNLIESLLVSPASIMDFHLFFNSMLDLCVAIKQISFFTDTVFNKLDHNSEMDTAFIRSTLPLILNNVVNELHPELVHRIVEYLERTEQFVQLDSCITKLMISCIDLDQIMKLAKKHHLFSSFIHIHNAAFNDYLTPIKYMIDFIAESSFVNCDREVLSETVNKAIVYIHCCFAGKDFFSGAALESSFAEEVKSNIFEYLIPFETNSEMVCLTALLEYNTNEFLNMITLAFDEQFFLSDIGVSRKQAALQRLCIHFTSEKLVTSKPETIRFFVFLSRELSKASNISIYIDLTMLDELIERVCLGINDFTQIGDKNKHSTVSFLHKQAETAFLMFLKTNSAYRDHWLKNERVLTLSRKAQFYRVCEFIYRQKKMLHMVLECFLLDPDYRTESFELIESAWNDDNVDDHQRSQIIDKCFQLAEYLILASPTLSVIVLLTICKKRVEEIINKLGGFKTTSESQLHFIYIFLKSLFVIRNELDQEHDPTKHASVSQQISVHIKSVKVQSKVAELFIDLLCKFDRDVLQTFLKYSVDYGNDNAIAIISRYDLPYSLGFLYEKAKQFDLASDLYIRILDELWLQCTENADLEVENCIISSDLGKLFQQSIDRFVHLVKKYKSVTPDTENLWTRMLDSILQKQVVSRTEPYDSMIRVIFTYFVKFLSQEVSMPTIMVTILKNPIFTGENFGKIRELVISMMTSFDYEKVLLESCISMVDKDVSNYVVQLETMMGSGVLVHDLRCSVCSKNLIILKNDENINSILTFRCGHRFHGDCLKSSGKAIKNQSIMSGDIVCTLCSVNTIRRISPKLKLLRSILHSGDTNDKQMKVSAPPAADVNPNNDLVSRDNSKYLSMGRLPSLLDGTDYRTSQKIYDIPFKLNLAPPNYLLNFSTFE